MDMPTIYQYTDFREFLKALFQFRKIRDRFFSYRYFSRKAGFKSPNFLKLVMDNQRNLTADSIARVAKGFDLKKQERDYFENMVYMNQSVSHDERNYFYKKMMAVKGFSSIRKLDRACYDYFSKWYYPAIREMIDWENAISPEQIASQLVPSITPKEVEKALNRLNELGLIKKDDSGKWIKTEQIVSTGPEVRSLLITNYHKDMIQMASESIERFPSHERDVTSVTLSINRHQMNAIKQKLAAFRKELLEMACAEDVADQVIQINIQAFPLTQ